MERRESDSTRQDETLKGGENGKEGRKEGMREGRPASDKLVLIRSCIVGLTDPVPAILDL
jgi:hypothetical protein